MFKNLITKQNAEGYKIWRNKAYKSWCFLSEEIWRIIKLWCSHQKGWKTFSLLYEWDTLTVLLHSAISWYLEDKTTQASFCFKEEMLTKYTDWKEGDVLIST